MEKKNDCFLYLGETKKAWPVKGREELTQNVHLDYLYNKLEKVDTDYKMMAWHKWLHDCKLLNLDRGCEEIRGI